MFESIVNHLNTPQELIFAFVFAGICVVPSVVYWKTNSQLSLTLRFLVSGHGVLTLLLVCCAFVVSELGLSSFAHVSLFNLLCMLPVISVGFSVFKHTGAKYIHLSLIPLLPIMFLGWFFGLLFVTGDSL